jgi:hypothetical protein
VASFGGSFDRLPLPESFPIDTLIR